VLLRSPQIHHRSGPSPWIYEETKSKVRKGAPRRSLGRAYTLGRGVPPRARLAGRLVGVAVRTDNSRDNGRVAVEMVGATKRSRQHWRRRED